MPYYAMVNVTALPAGLMVFLEEQIFYIVAIVFVMIGIIWLLVRG